jgi:hypothetical protein
VLSVRLDMKPKKEIVIPIPRSDQPRALGCICAFSCRRLDLTWLLLRETAGRPRRRSPPADLLDGVQRKCQAVVFGRYHQLHVDEVTGPQVAPGIGKICFGLNRARAGIGLVVHHDKAVDVELRLAVLAKGTGLHRPLAGGCDHGNRLRRGGRPRSLNPSGCRVDDKPFISGLQAAI